MTSSGNTRIPCRWLVAMACAASTHSVGSVDAGSASRSAVASWSRSDGSAAPPAATPPRNASSLGAACPSGYAIRGACVPVGTSPLQYYLDLVSALHLPASPSV